MPRYDFLCTDCQNVFEITCKISERSNPHPCPQCSSPKTEQRMFTAAQLGESHRLGFNDKGRGFKEVLRKIHTKTPGSVINKTTDI